ncbi:MAG: retropepsin-like aspartic protease [Phormidesmis sp.]
MERTSKQVIVSSVSSSGESIDNAIDGLPAAEPGLLEPVEPLPASAAYGQGINLASSADRLSRSALSPDDWGLVASRWQQAVDQLKQVTTADEDYEMAQQKIAEYTRNANYAAEQVVALQRSVRVVRPSAAQPLPTSSVTANALPQQVSVPVVRRLYGTPVVQVTFNGAKSYEMILDTGASRTLITRQMASELNVVATERMVAATASEAEVVFEIGQVRSISVGEITVRDVPVSIGDAVGIGLLGNDFLRGYDVTIRTRDNVVELVAAD